ncbi:hypothetical protein RhiirA4_423268 [Rhizophagus irregularis]|uniref:Uncharacterized protein n=1 Tax=Rhizophagus irregularis TaxID=588596 RepID=A0A2I1GT62_9GLOM|nr:hypothetical protein RhiirA4_423268 [Rhizophagus irregularis]
MFDVIEAIDIWMQKEALNKSFLAWKYKTIAYHQPFVVETFFSKINSVIQKYLTPHIIEEIHKQMCESVLYRCEKLEINDAFEFNEDQSVVYIKINNIFWDQGKGRPPTKRLKAFNEVHNKVGSTSTSQQINIGCEENEINGRMCHKTGHYAPKCPNKETTNVNG